MSELVICDHAAKCPHKCMGAGYPHDAVMGGCEIGYTCATVGANVKCIPVEQESEVEQ